MSREKQRFHGLWNIIENFVRQGLDNDMAFQYAAMSAELTVEQFRSMVSLWKASRASSLAYY